VSRTRMTARERREQLIGVARTVFAEKGYAAASVEEIAERAGVTRPVVYEHFGGKEGLYAVVIDREVTSLSELLARPLREARRNREAAEWAAAAFLRFIEEEPDGFRLLLRDGPPGSRGTLDSVIADVAARTEQLLAAAFDERGLDPATAPMYARMLVGAIAQVGEWWLEAREPSREEVTAHIINLMWNGMSGLVAEPRLRTMGSGLAEADGS
jgi:AcrR family transcriptional regulator